MAVLITPFPCPFADEPEKEAAKRDKEKYAEEEKITITQKPVKLPTGKGNHQWQVNLSDGTTCNLLEASRIAKVSQPTMHQRIKDGLWNHSDVMQKKLRRKKNKVLRDIEVQYKRRNRPVRLDEIAGPGKFELMYL